MNKTSSERITTFTYYFLIALTKKWQKNTNDIPKLR